MGISRLPVMVSVTSAVACGLAVDIYGWEPARTWLMPALSIIGAAVLVRLARGLPVTNPDHLREGEVNEVADSFTKLVRSLRTLFCAVLVTMLLVGLASPVARLMSDIWSAPFDWGNRSGSALVGLCVGFAFSRMVQIAQSDVKIADLQARLLKQAVARKRSDLFAKDEMQPTEFKTPEGYGKPLQ